MKRTMTAAALFRTGLFAACLLATTGCRKKFDEAVVLEKEHIAAAEPSPTPTAGASPSAAPSPTPDAEPLQTELAPDEIAVGSHVMKKNVRGTSKDPRAIQEEQWLIKVETVRERLIFTVQSDRAHFLKVKPGDRVRVRFKQGKYTGTVWSAKIED